MIPRRPLDRARLGPCAVGLALLAVASAGAAPPPVAAPVIPGGQDALVARMLGAERALPDTCRLEGAAITQDRITATYRCAEPAPIVVELVHPDTAPVAGVLTRSARFVVLARERAPSAALLASLEASIRADESAFRWIEVQPPAAPSASSPTPAEPDGPPDREPAPGPRPWGAWRVLAAVLLLAAARRLGGPPPWGAAPRREVSVVFGGALALRLALGLWGPFRHNGQAPDWVSMALGPTGGEAFYGPGYGELHGLFASLWPASPDLPVFALDALLSALAAALGFVLARALFRSNVAPLLVGTLLALDPISVRFAASEAPFFGIAALALGVAVALVSAARRFDAGQRVPAALLAVAAGLLAAQAVRIHPIAWLPIALAPMAVWAMDDRPAAARPLGSWLALSLTAGVTAAATTFDHLAGVVGRILVPRGDNPTALPLESFTHGGTWVAVALAGLATASALALLRRRRGAALLAGLGALALAATRETYTMSHLFTAGYDRIFFGALVPGIVGVATLWDGLERDRRRSLLVGVGVALALGAPYASALVHDTTEQAEYRFVAGVLGEAPGACRLLVPSSGDAHQQLRVPAYVTADGAAASRGATAVSTPSELERAADDAGPGACTMYLRTSLCGFATVAPTCAAIERSPRLRPRARRTFDARSSTDCWAYQAATVEVAIFDVVPPSPAEPAPPGSPPP